MIITRRRFKMINHSNLFGDTVPPPNKLTVKQFYALATQGGFKFEMDGYKIIIMPKHAIDDEMREFIVKNKAQLVELIISDDYKKDGLDHASKLLTTL